MCAQNSKKNSVAFVLRALIKQVSEQEAWWLLEKATGVSRTNMLANQYFDLTEKQKAQLEVWVQQRTEQHKPLQYILGSVPFCGLEIYVEPPILIPRPETEEWVSWVIQTIASCAVTNNNTKFSVLDMCCGSGCIGLALARAFPCMSVTGVDISTQALACAHKNKEHNNITNITFVQSDIYNNLAGDYRCNLIVANPPYLAAREHDALAHDVREWEDYQALVAGPTGLELYERILAGAKNILRPWKKQASHSTSSSLPAIIFEIGYTQDKAIQELLHKYNYKKYELKRDSFGAWRYVMVWGDLTNE